MRFFKSALIVASLAVMAVVLPSTGRSAPATSTSSDGSLTIVHVFTGWKDGASFKRISEYFNGKENTGGTVVLRTHPEERSGFYFLVRANNHGASAAVKINLELITPTETKPKAFTFSTDLKTGTNLFNLGLTANDWPDEKANPVAWKITIKGADDHLLATEKSYLWDKPETK